MITAQLIVYAQYSPSQERCIKFRAAWLWGLIQNKQTTHPSALVIKAKVGDGRKRGPLNISSKAPTKNWSVLYVEGFKMGGGMLHVARKCQRHNRDITSESSPKIYLLCNALQQACRKPAKKAFHRPALESANARAYSVQTDCVGQLDKMD